MNFNSQKLTDKKMEKIVVAIATFTHTFVEFTKKQFPSFSEYMNKYDKPVNFIKQNDFYKSEPEIKQVSKDK
jgi:hypothetical protein